MCVLSIFFKPSSRLRVERESLRGPKPICGKPTEERQSISGKNYGKKEPIGGKQGHEKKQGTGQREN
jgi:hypothetical protein